MKSIAIGLIPAVMWGIAPPLMKKYVKGGAYIQMLGTMLGVLVVSIILILIHGYKTLSFSNLLLAVLSGAMWPIGMYGQFASNLKIGVSRTFPISAGLQITGNALIGWILLNEWKTSKQISFGLFGILLVLIGIIVGNVTLSKEKKNQSNDVCTYVLLVATTIGYWLYALLPKYIPSTDSYSTFLLQAIGMIISAILITRICGKQKLSNLDYNDLLRASSVGLLYGIASFAYLISIRENGLVNGFLLGQLNLIIVTLIGMYILKEKQAVSRLQSWVGILFIIVGVILIEIL